MYGKLQTTGEEKQSVLFMKFLHLKQLILFAGRL